MNTIAGAAVLFGLFGMAYFWYFATFQPNYGETSEAERIVTRNLAYASTLLTVCGLIVYALTIS